MKDDSSKRAAHQADGPVGLDSIEVGVRGRIRGWIEQLVEAELAAVLGSEASERRGVDRVGYRHGHRERTLATSLGPTTFALPRARLRDDAGGTSEWRSAMVARYQRRTRRVDEALLGVYVSGTNARRIRNALAPLLRGTPMAKDAISRLTGRLAEDFTAWRERDLGQDGVRYLFLDGWYPKVRLGKRRVRVPVLVTLGVCGDGRRVLLDLRMVGDESAAAWREVIDHLVARHIGVPTLAVIDGNPSLTAALRTAWPTIAVQRCTVHIAGRNPRLPRGEMSPPGQVPMRPVVWGQTWRGNWPRRSRPDNVASVPSPEALTKSRAATKVNAFGAVNASWTSIAGRVQDQGGRVACVPTKTAATVETWGSETVVALGV